MASSTLVSLIDRPARDALTRAQSGILPLLAPALEPGKGAICFRDPVAPQFLIAICEVIAANSPFVQKGLTHA